MHLQGALQVQMFFYRIITVFVATATAVVANPLINLKRDSNSTTCAFVVTPIPDATLAVLDVDINFGKGFHCLFSSA